MHEYSPTVFNTFTASCTLSTTLQEETSAGVWADYSGPIATLDTGTQQVTITTTAADYGLDQTTMHFRVVIKSVALLSDANFPLLLDIYVKFVHPCYSAAFSDNGGVSASTIENTVFNAPHPSPLDVPVTAFPYDIQGSVDCGPQTISIFNTVITPGTMADFIAINDVGGVWTLTIEPINFAQEAMTFTLQLEVALDNYPLITYTSPSTFDVFIKENCQSGTVQSFLWNTNASTAIAV